MRSVVNTSVDGTVYNISGTDLQQNSSTLPCGDRDVVLIAATYFRWQHLTQKGIPAVCITADNATRKLLRVRISKWGGFRPEYPALVLPPICLLLPGDGHLSEGGLRRHLRSATDTKAACIRHALLVSK